MKNTRYPAIHANVARYYDLCVLVREAKAEMKLLNAQYEDLAADAQNEDAVEWLLSGMDRPAIKAWEDANPKWQVSGNGIRAKKQNDKAETPSPSEVDPPAAGSATVAQNSRL